ncbi:hypothetical protein [Microbacterium sp. NIBRBAC000506063]|uniref:hypothetical protein n=1 Tax=Microbacterium sp. NIBRBAC000506063 TaxID=2734618 RepID=UPI002948B974|nr:hypothetical protein [Microbacterium sp. NIBRBAC000506063]
MSCQRLRSIAGDIRDICCTSSRGGSWTPSSEISRPVTSAEKGARALRSDATASAVARSGVHPTATAMEVRSATRSWPVTQYPSRPR